MSVSGHERPCRDDRYWRIVLKKSFSADDRKILRTAGASISLRDEGPHQLPQKRSLALVSILQSLAAAEIANARHLRDFRSPAIFEFFNTIRQEPTSKRLFDHLVGAAE
jgi:hypothetical protein